MLNVKILNLCGSMNVWLIRHSYAAFYVLQKQHLLRYKYMFLRIIFFGATFGIPAPRAIVQTCSQPVMLPQGCISPTVLACFYCHKKAVWQFFPGLLYSALLRHAHVPWRKDDFSSFMFVSNNLKKHPLFAHH